MGNKDETFLEVIDQALPGLRKWGQVFFSYVERATLVGVLWAVGSARGVSIWSIEFGLVLVASLTLAAPPLATLVRHAVARVRRSDPLPTKAVQYVVILLATIGVSWVAGEYISGVSALLADFTTK